MSGICSYLIGDCLRFVELFPRRFLFEGRTAAFLSLVDCSVGADILERPSAARAPVLLLLRPGLSTPS